VTEERKLTRRERMSNTTVRWQRDRYAERIVMNGFKVHPHGAHGQLRSYTAYGCRGPLCYATHKYYAETGVTQLPLVGNRQFTAHECATFTSEVYVDTRRPR